MKINKATVYYNRSIQMRQFEPASVSVSLEVQIDMTDKPEVAIAEARRIARSQVEAERDKLLDQRLRQDDEREKVL